MQVLTDHPRLSDGEKLRSILPCSADNPLAGHEAALLCQVVTCTECLCTSQALHTSGPRLSLQVLREHHRLSDGDMQRVFRMLRVHSMGFHHLTCEATQHARDRGTLLLSIWRAYGGLWDAALQVGALHGQDSTPPCSAPSGAGGHALSDGNAAWTGLFAQRSAHSKLEAAWRMSLCGGMFAERDDCSTLAGSGRGLDV